ncbi:MAG: hypothetical protein ACHREM_07875 [Polyangiales bacterium]
MKHIAYALFDRDSDLAIALDAVVEAGVSRQQCTIVAHRGDLHPEDIEHTESAAMSGLARGAILGGVMGAVAGELILGDVASSLAIASATAVFGGFAGVLGGAGHPSPLLEQLTEEVNDGRVLLIVDARDLESLGRVEAVLRGQGGALIERSRARHDDSESRPSM